MEKKKNKLLLLETKKKAYLFALALAGALTLTSCGKKHNINDTTSTSNIDMAKEIDSEIKESNDLLVQMYDSNIENLPEEFTREELKIATRFPEMDPNKQRDYFFISENQYIKCSLEQAEYKKYPKLTDQSVYILDYNLFPTNDSENFNMIPCLVKLTKEINWVPSPNICFRSGIFDIEDILPPESIKEVYSIAELKEIENIINQVDYKYKDDIKNKNYNLNDLALLEDIDELYLINPKNYVQSAEPLTFCKSVQIGYQYYPVITQNKVISEMIEFNTSNKEINYVRTNRLSNKPIEPGTPPEQFYISNLQEYLPEDLLKDTYSIDDLIEIEKYFNQNKLDLFSEKNESLTK